MWWPFSRKYPERSAQEVENRAYDYVVIGGGTAECVLASRLSEDQGTSVLVLERGVANDTWLSRIPIVSSNIHGREFGAAGWRSEPMKFCEDKTSMAFRGEVLGGTSRINGCLYTRGIKAVYDSWGADHPEWSYEKALPYFKRSETSLTNARSSWRGSSGPWINQNIPYLSWPYNAYQVFAQCAETMGFSIIPDMSSPEAPSDGLLTIDAIVDKNRNRISTFAAFLPRKLALERENNLTICTAVIVSRIAFTSDKVKPRAEKVLFRSKDSISKKEFSVKVNKEVIVCSGALGSPQVLMLSGIGPKKHLQDHKIEVIRDLPGVGSELHPHRVEVPLAESVNYIVTSPLRILIEVLKYLLFGTGLLSLPIQALSLFVRGTSLNDDTSDLISADPEPDNDGIPDIEIMPLSTSTIDNMTEVQQPLEKTGVFSMLATLLRPKSRGSVRLRSPNPHDKPKVDFGLLSNPEDYILARKAVRLSLKLGAAMKASGFPLLKGISVPISEMDNDELDKVIRLYARTTYHYSSTCRMGEEKDGGVVDDQLKVHGLENVRVCDASIFPQILATHLMAPVVMVAEKCADMIKKR